MPVTLDTPIAPPSIGTIDDVELHFSCEANKARLICRRNGTPEPLAMITMDGSDFQTAFLAQTGTFRARVYKVALAQLGVTGTVT